MLLLRQRQEALDEARRRRRQRNNRATRRAQRRARRALNALPLRLYRAPLGIIAERLRRWRSQPPTIGFWQPLAALALAAFALTLPSLAARD